MIAYKTLLRKRNCYMRVKSSVSSRGSVSLLGQNGYSSFCVNKICTFVLTNVSIKWTVSFLTNHTVPLLYCTTSFLVEKVLDSNDKMTKFRKQAIIQSFQSIWLCCIDDKVVLVNTFLCKLLLKMLENEIVFRSDKKGLQIKVSLSTCFGCMLPIDFWE